jgi:hypothetical protein
MRNHLSRRDFNKLTTAALGGMAAGTWTGCNSATTNTAQAAPDIHSCRGLNSCKGQGADAKNACAGQGTCATAKHHDCANKNDCKHQGGCGEAPGMNDCKTKGGCEVPMQPDMWQKARTQFEQRMKQDNKEIGAAPALAK